MKKNNKKSNKWMNLILKKKKSKMKKQVILQIPFNLYKKHLLKNLKIEKIYPFLLRLQNQIYSKEIMRIFFQMLYKNN